jgi:AcrR family transcriptional regulator
MPSSAAAVPRLRADARRNRDRLLLAARDVFVARGALAPLDDIARGAGVGIATLYRRFPDRRSLMRAVALDALKRIGHEARLALEEEREPFHALARYMHRTLDSRVAALMPTLVSSGIPLDDADIAEARAAAVEPVSRIIERAHADGSLRPDVTFGDISLLLIRLSRPQPQPITDELDNSLAHRHLAVVLAGLRASPENAAAPLSGPTMTLADLRGL